MIKYRILFFIIILTNTHSLFSQTVLLPEEEAPSSIFSINKDGSDVDLYVLGTWETNITGGFGFSWNSEDKSLKESTFPSMISGFQLVHKPDIVISLWLLNSYFFETSFIDDYKLNTIVFGYESPEENFLQSVRIGNTDIGFGDYSYLSIPKASTDSMGGMALFKTDKAEHQLMVRYDPAELQVKNYIGKSEVDPLRKDLKDYIKGRYFILPDNNVDNLEVYIEDSSGIYSDGTHQYRLADSNDAIISAEEGIVFFRQPLTVRAAVHYTKNGYDVGNTALGRGSLAKDSDGLANTTGSINITADGDDFYFPASAGTYFYLGQDLFNLKLLINSSKTALLLYEPGVFSPFEMLSVYSLPYLIPDNPALFQVDLVDIGLSSGENPDMSTTFEDYMVRFLYNGESFRDPANRYPFAASIDTDSLIYEPDKELNGTPSDKELLIQKLFPSGSYYLGDNILEGSVSVKFNDHNEYRYTFNPDSGTVNFLFPVPSDANIEISYRTMTTSNLAGDFLLALGSKFNFSDNFFLETGAGLRWNILDSKYIEQPGDASGSIMGTAGLSYKSNNFNIRIDAGVSVHSPNTTGILRLDGMNKSGFAVPLSANYLYPAAPPESGVSTGTRGKLYYKDYHKYDSIGISTLMYYLWTPPSDQIYNYDNGGRTGPYIAATGSEIDGDTAVFDYSLEAGEWTGGRIPLTLGSESIDLSSTQSISLKWKQLDPTGSVKVYLRVGKLAEDLDNDNILDKEISKYDSGFNFNDGSYTMKVGLAADSSSGNNQLDTEDLDGNEILDSEGSNLVFTQNQTVPGSNWETLTINLSPSERETLKAVTGFEIIIVENAASAATGHLLIGDISFNSSSFITKPAEGQIVTANEVNEEYTSNPTPLLTTNYPETDIFSTSVGAQNVAEITWDTAGTWQAATYTETADMSDYNKISFYMKTPATAPGDITFSLTNSSGNGISLNFPPVESSQWIKYTIDYKNGNLSADGSKVSGVTWLKNNQDSKDVNRLSLAADCSTGGALLLDEVHFEDPVIGVSGAASTTFNYKKPGTLVKYKNTAVLSNFNFTNSSSITGKNFASGFANNSDSTIYTASGAAISLFAMRLNGNLNLQWQNTELFTSPALSVSIPFLNNNLILKDSYSEINLPLTFSTTRESSLAAKFLNSSFFLSGASSFSTQNLIRNWGMSSDILLKGNSSLASSADFTMTSKELPYDNMNSVEKFTKSYSLFIPSTGLNDRNTNINIKPVIELKSVKIKINEFFGSNAFGIDVRELSSDQLFSINAKYSFNSRNSNKWNIIPEYKKTMSNSRYLITDNNFFTDSSESVKNLGAQSYYYEGFPLWEIFFPDFGTQFKDTTTEEINAVYTPEFSLAFSRLSGSEVKDIFLPSAFSLNLSRNLKRDFDSITDSMNIKLEIKATALNIFGKLGVNPIFKWYQTEEITNILTLNGEYRSYTDEILNDPAFNLNYILFLNFNINKQDSIQFESNQNVSWLPVIWKNNTSASYLWEVIPKKMIKIPLLQNTETNSKPYFEHSEKITWSTSSDYDLNTSSFTLTLNHSTNLVFKDKGNISIFAGLGIDQKRIKESDKTIKYYLFGMEAGISAKLTF